MTRSLVAGSLGTSAQDTFLLIFWCLWLCRITICFDLGGQTSDWISLAFCSFGSEKCQKSISWFSYNSTIAFLLRLKMLGLSKSCLCKSDFVILRNLVEVFYRGFKYWFRNCFRDLFQLLLLSTQNYASLRSQFAISYTSKTKAFDTDLTCWKTKQSTLLVLIDFCPV